MNNNPLKSRPFTKSQTLYRMSLHIKRSMRATFSSVREDLRRLDSYADDQYCPVSSILHSNSLSSAHDIFTISWNNLVMNFCWRVAFSMQKPDHNPDICVWLSTMVVTIFPSPLFIRASTNGDLISHSTVNLACVHRVQNQNARNDFFKDRFNLFPKRLPW